MVDRFQHIGLLYIVTTLLIATVQSVTKELHFTEEDCKEYRHYLKSEDDKYNIVWNGEDYPTYCNLRFKLQTGVDKYRICAKVTRLNLECGKDISVEYEYFSTQYRKYDCRDTVPVTDYCSEDIIYVHLEPYEDPIPSNSNLRITISATLVSRYRHHADDGDSSTGGIAAGVGIGCFVLVLIGIIVCVMKKRQATMRQLQQSGGVVVLGRGGNVIVIPGQQSNQMPANQPGGNPQFYPAPQSNQMISSPTGNPQFVQGHYMENRQLIPRNQYTTSSSQQQQYNTPGSHFNVGEGANIQSEKSHPPPSYNDVVI